jgi:hypothetical protein
MSIWNLIHIGYSNTSFCSNMLSGQVQVVVNEHGKKEICYWLSISFAVCGNNIWYEKYVMYAMSMIWLDFSPTHEML